MSLTVPTVTPAARTSACLSSPWGSWICAVTVYSWPLNGSVPAGGHPVVPENHDRADEQKHDRPDLE